MVNTAIRYRLGSAPAKPVETPRVVGRLAALGLVLLLGACGGPAKPTPDIAARPVWPPPPAAARIAFEQTFSMPDDLGIHKGLWERLADLVLGPEERAMVRPMAVVKTAEGVVYVADPGVQGVHRFDPAGESYALIRGEDGRPLPSPVGLALGRDGEVYVTDSALGQVLAIPAGAETARALPRQAGLEQPTGIAFDPDSGRLYVVDTAVHRVKVLGMDGRLQSSFGGRGSAAGELNYPTMIWRDRHGRLLVTDALNFRIQTFAADGSFLGKFGEPGQAVGWQARPKGVAASRFGHVYVVDSLLHAVQVFDRSGTFLMSLGSQGREIGQLWLPAGIFVDDRERIYVADAFNRRVQVFRYIGKQDAEAGERP
jgi:DNA-binding beta-propeller fold protein YncE